MKLRYVRSAFLVLMSCACFAVGDDETAFRRDYAKAFEKMQEAYSNQIVKGVCTHYDESDKFDFSEDTTLYVSGDKAMWVATRKENTRADDPYPVGSYMVRGGSKELFFGASKLPGSNDFVFDNYGPVDEKDFQASVRRRCFTAYTPYTLLASTIAELLDGEFDYKFKSATAGKLNGKDVMIAALDSHDQDNKPISVQVVLDPETYVILEYTFHFGNALPSGRVVYEDNILPRKVKSVEIWEGQVGVATKINRMKFDVTSIKFEKPPEEIFTPAGVGITEVPVPAGG